MSHRNETPGHTAATTACATNDDTTAIDGAPSGRRHSLGDPVNTLAADRVVTH